MSTHAAVEDTRTTTDAQVIAELADAVLASVARIHADGLAALTAIAENPVRLPLPPVAEVAAEPEAPVQDEPVIEDEAIVDEAIVDDEPVIDDEPVVRISEPLQLVPQPRGRHLSEAVTDEIAVQTAA